MSRIDPNPIASRRPTILLIGANGQVGWELRRTLAPIGGLIAASLKGDYGPRVDLADPQSLRDLIRATSPDAVVNAAAYTAVDRAEDEPELARQVNADAPGLLGDLLAARGIPIVHYSTDFVFDGTSDRPYREDDQPKALNVYGETKLGGERAIIASGANAIVLRTSWVYSLRGHNFLSTMLHLFREKDDLRVVDDQIGAPTWSRMLAEVTAQILHRALSDASAARRIKGIYHVTGTGQTSWYGFARTILEQSGLECRLLPIPSSEYRSPASRPAYSVLDNAKLWDSFRLVLPHWEESLHLCLEELR